MERLNRVTLKKDLVRKTREEKPLQVFLTVNNNLSFSVSKGLFVLLDAPGFVEFISDSGKLFIAVSDPENGFRLNSNNKAGHFSFSCSYIAKEFFNSQRQRAVVFTDPVSCRIEEGPILKAYEIRLPK